VDHSELNRVAVVGVGLIGGSWAMTLRSRSGARRITGVGRTRENLDHARSRGIIDDYQHDIDETLSDVDLFVLAAPLRQTRNILEKIVPVMKPDAVLTDVGSVKRDVVEIARSVLGDRINRFVPGHPIAGTEKSGAGAAFDSLFHDRLVILTPQTETDQTALSLVTRLWQDAGAFVQSMDVDRHDDVLARTSHLPHAIR